MNKILEWTKLLSSEAWAHVVCCSEKEVDNFAKCVPRDSGAVVRIIRGRRCSTDRAFFQEWAAALQFPYYFGENWDAFEECITDLEWLPADCYVFFITHTDRLLAGNEQAFRIMIDILKKGVQEWAISKEKDKTLRSANPLRVVFHCEPENQADALARLKQAYLNTDECFEIRMLNEKL